MISTHKHSLPFTGLFLWLCLSLFLRPSAAQSIEWVKVLFLFAPLVLVPAAAGILHDMDAEYPRPILMTLAGGVVLAIAFLMPQGLSAGVLSGLWLLNTIGMAFAAMRVHNRRFVILAGFIYLPIGAAWAVADRLGLTPLGFDPVIGLLTAVHFHYAGFLLPVITSLALEHWKGRGGRLIGVGVIAGVPLVALGITISHIGGLLWIETASSTVMALAGMGVAGIHLLLLKKTDSLPVRLLWIATGIFLFGGMVLALLYGWRYFFPLPFLSIPWMYAVHGTINTLALTFAIAGWAGYPSKPAGEA